MSPEQNPPSQEITQSLLDAVLQARITYNRIPEYHQSFATHPVYLQAKSLFDQKVNDWGLADGTDFLKTIGDLGLKIEDVRFINWGKRDEQGSATTLQASSYIFDSQKNIVKFVDTSGRVYELSVAQYGVAHPLYVQTGNTVRMRIPSDPTKEDISVEFTLATPGQLTTVTGDQTIVTFGAPFQERADTPFPDIDRLVVATLTPNPDTSMSSIAMQRHGDYYINMLLMLDPEIDQARLDLEMGQIYAAARRLENEEIGSIFHPGLVKVKLEGASGGFVQRCLAKLVQDNIQTPEELGRAETAIELITSGKSNYPVNVVFLEQLIEEARRKLQK